MADLELAPATGEERVAVLDEVARRWAGRTVARRGGAVHLDDLPVMIAKRDGSVLGAAVYLVEGRQVEVVTLDAFAPGEGVGSALLEAVAEAGRAAGCTRLWLIATNDNVSALGFYLRRGLRLVAVHQGAVAGARLLKPGIPEFGEGGIPIEDEIELERWL